MSNDRHQEEKENHPFPSIDLGLQFRVPLEWKHVKWEVEEKKTFEYNPHDIEPGHGKVIIVSKWMGFSKSVWAVLNVDGKRLEHYRL